MCLITLGCRLELIPGVLPIITILVTSSSLDLFNYLGVPPNNYLIKEGCREAKKFQNNKRLNDSNDDLLNLLNEITDDDVLKMRSFSPEEKTKNGE